MAGLFYASYTTGTLGNVLQTISYGYTDSNWKDKLTSYDGMDISYDAIGNITGYNDMMFVWGAGRRLSACMADSMILFGYDSQGERIRKFAAGVATLYTMHGKLLTHLTKGSDYMHFYYDANSRPAMVDYNGTHYTYLHNLQGDVVGLVDSANSIVVEYKYDAWGKLLSTTGTLASTLGYLNPFRYRSYIYDEETGLYYLHSRYYDPRIGRFINRDTIIGTWGLLFKHNGFCYARNCPVVIGDVDGYTSIYILYDGRPDESEGGKGFPIQTEWWYNYLMDKGYSVTKEGFVSVEEFIEDWNNMPDDSDYLLIIAHGAEGTLDCYGERLGIAHEAGSDEYPITHLSSELNPKTVKKMTILLTCNGATAGYQKVSLANIIADKTQSVVYAAKNAKVNYIKGTGIPYLAGDSLKTIVKALLMGCWFCTFPKRK